MMRDSEAPEPQRFAGRRVLALGTFDSFVATAVAIGRLFEVEGASLKVAALAAEPGQLSARQLAAGGAPEETPVLDAAALVASRLFRDAHVVIAAIDGGRARALFLAMAAADFSREPRRPIVVVASPGVVLADHLAGFMSRAPSDVLCFNTEGDRALYETAAAAIGLDATNAVVTGLLGLDRSLRSASTGRPAIVFFEQPVIPAFRLQRAYLISALGDLARRCPEADVLIKLRHGPGERAHHATRYPFEELAAEVFAEGGRPADLSFTQEPAAELIGRAALVVTVSSTAAVEAIARGTPTRIVSDFGISEALGTGYFVGSGCLAPVRALNPGLGVSADPAWVAASGAVAAPEPMLAQCAALLHGQDLRGAALPLRPLAPAYGSQGWIDFALKREGAVAIHAPHKAGGGGSRLGALLRSLTPRR